ncbi:winged helix-turn-helix domain-containing protein [Geitlerinema sp. CS-897]|nr:winged helix-turn-helix domain-containing protein [Geitlerinema sp. CS-897]
MHSKFGRAEKVWKQRGWDYLKKCGYSWQRPRPKHKKGVVLYSNDAGQSKSFQGRDSRI